MLAELEKAGPGGWGGAPPPSSSASRASMRDAGREGPALALAETPRRRPDMSRLCRMAR